MAKPDFEIPQTMQEKARMELATEDSRVKKATRALMWCRGIAQTKVLSQCAAVVAEVAEELDLSPIYIPDVITARINADLEEYSRLIEAGYA